MSDREDIVRYAAPGSVAAELGVATGQFSERLLETGRVSVLYSIDAWNDGGHNTAQMAVAKARLARFGDASQVIRSTFEKACPRFADGFFDFIYIDGYAHTGQEDGQTLRDWWPKLKSGGVFAGDDYCSHWPKTVAAVDKFFSDLGLEVRVHTFDRVVDKGYDLSPGWYVFKP